MNVTKIPIPIKKASLVFDRISNQLLAAGVLATCGVSASAELAAASEKLEISTLPEWRWVAICKRAFWLLPRFPLILLLRLFFGKKKYNKEKA